MPVIVKAWEEQIEGEVARMERPLVSPSASKAKGVGLGERGGALRMKGRGQSKTLTNAGQADEESCMVRYIDHTAFVHCPIWVAGEEGRWQLFHVSASGKTHWGAASSPSSQVESSRPVG